MPPVQSKVPENNVVRRRESWVDNDVIMGWRESGYENIDGHPQGPLTCGLRLSKWRIYDLFFS